jgi:hypothetical protein
MSELRSPTRFEEVKIRTYYGGRSLQWIDGRLGCSAATVSEYAKQLGLGCQQPGRRRAGNPSCRPNPRAVDGRVSNPRRVYKIGA